MTVETLGEVRSIARVRAQEDFEFFATTVLGLRVETHVCDLAQRAAETDSLIPVTFPEKKYEGAFHAWLSLSGRRPLLTRAPSETFKWLFAECIAA